MPAMRSDLLRLGWSVCPLQEDLTPAVDPKPLVSKRLLELPDAPAYGVVTGPISQVYATRGGDGAPAAVASDQTIWGLWPTRPSGRKTLPAGSVVPVAGPGVRWVRGAPSSLVGSELQRTAASAMGGDPAAMRTLLDDAARARGLACAPEIETETTWRAVEWPRPPTAIPWADYLPGVLGSTTRAIVRNIGAAESFTGLMVLGLAAAALSARVEVAMLDAEGEVWREDNAGLFVMGIAPSGAKKSPVMDALMPPWASEAARIYKATHADKIADEQERSKARAIQRTSKEEDEIDAAAAILSAPERRIRKLYVADVTPAALIRDLSIIPTQLITTAEASKIFTNGLREGGGAEIEGLLHGYAGEPFAGASRIGREINVVPGTRLRCSLVGAIQPAILHGVGKTSAFADQGLMARILFASWEEHTPRRGSALPAKFAAEWRAFMNSLWAIPEVKRGPDGTDSGSPRTLQIGPEGTAALLDLMVRLANRTTLGGDLAGVVSWTNKAHGQAARIAGLMAIAEGGTNIQEVPTSIVLRAIDLVEQHLLPHAIAAWGLAAWPEGTDDARHLWAAAKSYGLEGPWSVRDLESIVGAVDWSPAKMRRAIAILDERGFIRKIPGARDLYLPNPLADRAAQTGGV